MSTNNETTRTISVTIPKFATASQQVSMELNDVDNSQVIMSNRTHSISVDVNKLTIILEWVNNITPEETAIDGVLLKYDDTKILRRDFHSILLIIGRQI
jgi:hypothetical protein